ncbi:tetratricopeptide repeat protein [Dictyobacter sp. S3.2.2.5]|uniref:Tetratricopeptide repeat protein n=1 Tax=Dictyobacter halimunensis TaxID=3026934 RepID=A0ABQ6FKF3_9CHLR|nr:tetratricopeptide repeat protein [Dictyobacter sp. S3.2.2.5]
MAASAARPLNIFISYVERDQELLQDLENHLATLKQQGLITNWQQHDIRAGEEWKKAVMQHLEAADIIFLLISADFLASEHCSGVEMARAIERHDRSEARVIPIILRPCDWQGSPFEKLTCLPSNRQPVTSWQQHDSAFLDIVTELRKIIEELNQPRFVTPDSPICHIPYERNFFFTGRDEVLDRLHSSFQTMATQAISGLGGIGKTQIAIEYVYRYQDDYQAILWAQADSREALLASIDEIAQQLKLPERQESNHPLLRQAFKRWLQEHAGWLLVLDNADDLALVRDILPTATRGHILLTTRTQILGRIAHRVEIEQMAGNEGALFLLRRATLLDVNQSLDDIAPVQHQLALEIVEQTGGLPLALDQAGAYIEETRCNLHEYLILYQTRLSELLKRRGQNVLDHPAPVTTTWSLSIDKVQHKNPKALEILRLCAFLDPDAIPLATLSKGARHLGPDLEQLGQDPIALNDALAELRNYSLIQRNPNQTLTIHRLVQAVLLMVMEMETQRTWAVRIVRAFNRLIPRIHYGNWPRCFALLPHAKRCIHLIDRWQMKSTEAATLLNWTGRFLAEQATYAEAEIYLQKALALREKILGPRHRSTISSINNLARLYHKQAKYTQAEPLYQKALEISEQTIQRNMRNITTSLLNLARLYSDRGKYTQARPLYQRALDINEQAFGTDHTGNAIILNHLSSLYRYHGEYTLAIECAQRALTIREQILESDDPDIAQSLNYLARVYHNQKTYARAEELYLRALDILEKKLEPGNPLIAINLNYLAELYGDQAQYEQAERLAARALAIREAISPNHPDTTLCLSNLASLYHQQNKDELAEPLFKRALSACEQVLGSKHPITARRLISLAQLYHDQQKYQQAEQLYRRALAVDEQCLGPDHPHVAMDLNYLALLYHAMGRYQETEHLFQRAFEICTHLNANHPFKLVIDESYHSLKTSSSSNHQVRRIGW